MLKNADVTIYHKTFDEVERLEKWIRYIYKDIWFFGGRGAGLNKGYADANDVDVRIFYENNDIDINNISIGDIIVKGSLDLDINTQQDLKNYEIYNVTSINNNTFGNTPHVHIGGK